MIKKIVLFLMCVTVCISALFGINPSAEEVTDGISFSYMRQGVWKSFGGTEAFADYIDCIKIQTDPNKSYYLNYRTWNEGKTGYYSYVQSNKSGAEDYAGASGRRIRNIAIQVLNSSDGSKIDSGTVVMYRAKVNGVWLPWVSNAGADWMKYIQRKYGLDGVLDTKSGNAGLSDGSFIEGLDIRIFEEQGIEASKGESNKTQIINAPFISQAGSYPTGCESVSTVMALNYAGDDISVDTFIDTYLPKGSEDSFDPNLTFGGDPRSSSGMGCYSPVIEAAAEKAAEGKRIIVQGLKNQSLKSLCHEYIDRGVPVIIWATADMAEAYVGKSFTYEDRKIQWIAPEHCLLLVGYDEENYIFNDPLKSQPLTYYSRSATENAYYALGAQAVVIEALPAAEDSEYINHSLPESVKAYPNADVSGRGYTTEKTILSLEEGRRLQLKVKYSSSVQAKGWFGIGWYCDFEKRLEISNGEIYIYETPSLYGKYVLQDGSDYKCVTPGMQDYALTVYDNGGYILNRNGNGTEYYDTQGRLYKLADKYGFETLITYDGDVISIKDKATDNEIKLYSQKRKITTAVGSNSKSASISYTGDMLMSVTTALDKTAYTYDKYGRMLTVSNNGEGIANIVYNQSGELSDINGSTVFTYSDKTVTVASGGETNVYTFDSNGLLTEFKDADGNICSFGYDGNFNIISEITPEHNLKLTYQSAGRPAKITDSDNKSIYFYYDERGNLTKKVYPLAGDADSDGYVNVKDLVRLKRYAAGIECEIAEGNIDISSADKAAQLAYLKRIVLSKAEQSNLEKFSYNSSNQLISHTDVNGNTAHYSYDEFGNLN